MTPWTTDEIVDIPENRVKFFGTTGRMLLPCPATIAAVLAGIPADRLMTTEQLRRHLSAQFEVEGTCPVTTRKALQVLADQVAADPTTTLPLWRLLNQDGGLNAQFPGGIAAQAERLRAAGFTVEQNRKTPKVAQYQAALIDFA